MHDTLVGVDIAKAVLQVAVSGRAGHFDSHRRLSRDQFLPFVAQLAPAVFVLEACGMAHHSARKIRQHGHAVVLLSPHLVRPYVRRNKTDRTDAVALVEAYRHGQIRPVPVKTPEQQLLTSLHRLRAGWVRQGTARLNTLRGLLREQGFLIALGAKHVLPTVAAIIEDWKRTGKTVPSWSLKTVPASEGRSGLAGPAVDRPGFWRGERSEPRKNPGHAASGVVDGHQGVDDDTVDLELVRATTGTG